MNAKSCEDCGNRIGLKRTKEGSILCRMCLDNYSSRRSELQAQMEEGHHILDHIFLGSEQRAADLDFLTTNNITRVLVIGGQIDKFFEGDPRFTYHVVPIADETSANIRQHFEECFKFIEKRLNDWGDEEGNLLIHCVAGMSRSPTITIAYLMQKYGLPLAEAYNYVKQKRPIIEPNAGFMEQLRKFEEELRQRGLIRLPGTTFPGGLTPVQGD